MPDYGTDKLSLQNTTGAIQNLDGGPILSTDSFGESSFIFSPQVQREIFYGITNGDFSQPTANLESADFASDDNPIPYWSTTQSATPSTGTVGFRSAVDATTPSGYKLRTIATAGATTGGTTILSRFVPLGANASRDVGFHTTITFGLDATATNSTARTLAISGIFYAADGTTIAGTAFAEVAETFADYLTDLGSGQKTWEPTETFLPSSNAAFLKYTFTVATTGTDATERWIDLIDVSLYRTPPVLRVQEVNTPSVYTEIRSGQIVSVGTPLVMRGGTSTANSINLNNGTLTAGYYISSEGVRIGGDTVGGTVLFGTSGGSFDTNLYRPAANTLKTDDAFQVGGLITGAGSTMDLHHGITLQRTTTLSIGTATDVSATAIPWSSAVKNTTLYAYWSTGSTITIPIAGWYSITCHLTFASGTGYAARLYALVNGTVIAETDVQAQANTTSDTIAISTLAYLSASDALVFRAAASTTGKTVGGSARNRCSVVYIGNTSA